MKKQITLQAAVGQRLIGHIQRRGDVLFVFEEGYILVDAFLDDDAACLDTTSELYIAGHQEADIAASGIGTAREVAQAFDQIKAQQQIEMHRQRLQTATEALRSLASVDPEAARQLVAEAAQKYRVKP